MLAKEIKFKTYGRQKKTLAKMLNESLKREDGNTAFRYVGHIYPEIIKYFEEEGYNVTKLDFPAMLVKTNGFPMYVFTIKDEISLNDEEIKLAEVYENAKGDDYTRTLVVLSEIM